MESAENPRSPSPKRSDRSLSPTFDDKEKQTYIRFLVSNVEAGCIIGKGGSTISELQSLSGTRMQLSRNHELFPGTSERIVMVSGTIDGIMRAIELVLDRLANEAHMQAEETDGEEIISKVTLIIPNSSCGGIIGKGGATIKSFIEDSHAGIKITPQDKNYFGLNDRLVTLNGSIEDCKHALSLIITKLMEDARYSLSAISPYPYAGVSFSGAHGFPVGYGIPSASYNRMYMPNGTGGKYRGNKGMMSPASSTRPSAGASEATGISVTIGVADEHIGAVVGRGGRKIIEIMQASGARIKISDRSDFLPGTSDRKVTITGSREAIRIAEDMIMDKVESISESS